MFLKNSSVYEDLWIYVRDENMRFKYRNWSKYGIINVFTWKMGVKVKYFMYNWLLSTLNIINGNWEQNCMIIDALQP